MASRKYGWYPKGKISARIDKNLHESLMRIFEKKKEESGIELTLTQVIELVLKKGIEVCEREMRTTSSKSPTSYNTYKD